MQKSAKKSRVRNWDARTPLLEPIACDGRTNQHMKDECDINKIMDKYRKTGTIAHLAKYQGNYEDFTVMPDFHTAMNTMQEAQDMFLTIPAELRAEFQNDPGVFVEFATNPDNLEKMREYGLALPPNGVVPTPKPGTELPPDTPKTDDKSESD